MNNMCVLDNWVGYDYKSIALPAELQGHEWIYKSKAIFCNTK